MLTIVRLFTRYKLVRFIISGGIGATVHLGVVFILTHVFGVWYLYATSAGFMLAIGVSFVLQKFWTFQNVTTDLVHKQGTMFTGVAVFNFILNGFLMSIFVENFGLMPVVAQAGTSVLIAFESFLAYSLLFREQGGGVVGRVGDENSSQ
jgi:putative flippase GtrA